MKGTLSRLGCPCYSAIDLYGHADKIRIRGVAINGSPSGSMKRLGDHERPSVLFCSVLFCSVLFCSVLFCSVLWDVCSVEV